MTDLQLLFAILALLYLWECAAWVRRGSVVFRTWFGSRWSSRHPGTLLGNQRGGFVFAPPLPPLGTSLTGTHFPLCLGPEGLLLFVAPSVNPGGRPPQSGRFFLWSQVQEVRTAGKKLFINGESLLSVGSEQFAQFVALQLREIKKAPESARAGHIRKAARAMFEVSSLKKRIELLEQKSRWISVLTNGLFTLVFCVAPVFIWRFGLASVWPVLLGSVLAGTLALALLFRRAHRALFPQAADERFTNFLIVLLSPATSIRALDLLSRRVVETFHPLAVARALCSGKEFETYACFIWRELCHPALPLCPEPSLPARTTEEFWRKTLITEVERLLDSAGLEPDKLLPVPQPNDSSCIAYCPRCEAQYTALPGVCEDCGGLKLQPLPRNAPASK